MNNLSFSDEQILKAYRMMFPFALFCDKSLQQLISHGRWKAKCELWLQEQLDIVRRAASDTVSVPRWIASEEATIQEIVRSAWASLRHK